MVQQPEVGEIGLAVLKVLVEHDPVLLLQPLCRVSIQLWRLLPVHWPQLRPAERWVLWHKQADLWRYYGTNEAWHKQVESLHCYCTMCSLHRTHDLHRWWRNFVANQLSSAITTTSMLPIELYVRYAELPQLFPLFTDALLDERDEDALALCKGISDNAYDNPDDMCAWHSHLDDVCCTEPIIYARLSAFYRAHVSDLSRVRWVGEPPPRPVRHPAPEGEDRVEEDKEYRDAYDWYEAWERAQYASDTTWIHPSCLLKELSWGTLFHLFTHAALHGSAEDARVVGLRIPDHDSSWQPPGFTRFPWWKSHIDALCSQVEPTACARLHAFCLEQGYELLTTEQWHEIRAGSSHQRCRRMVNGRATRTRKRIYQGSVK
jgi:hypothetical protein